MSVKDAVHEEISPPVERQHYGLQLEVGVPLPPQLGHEDVLDARGQQQGAQLRSLRKLQLQVRHRARGHRRTQICQVLRQPLHRKQVERLRTSTTTEGAVAIRSDQNALWSDLSPWPRLRARRAARRPSPLTSRWCGRGTGTTSGAGTRGPAQTCPVGRGQGKLVQGEFSRSSHASRAVHPLALLP